MQAEFDLKRSFARRKLQTVCKAENVRVHGNGGQFERDAHNDVGSLASDTGQLNQLVEVARNCAAVIFKQQPRSPDDVLCL